MVKERLKGGNRLRKLFSDTPGEPWCNVGATPAVRSSDGAWSFSVRFGEGSVSQTGTQTVVVVGCVRQRSRLNSSIPLL